MNRKSEKSNWSTRLQFEPTEETFCIPLDAQSHGISANKELLIVGAKWMLMHSSAHVQELLPLRITVNSNDLIIDEVGLQIRIGLTPDWELRITNTELAKVQKSIAEHHPTGIVVDRGLRKEPRRCHCEGSSDGSSAGQG